MTRNYKPIRTASAALRSIFEEMERRNISQAAMAELMGRNQRRFSEWRLGNVEPGILTLEEIAHHLGCRLVLEPIKENTDA